MSKTICIKWGVEDVLHQAKEDGVELSEVDAENILSNIDRKHDATIGVNWDVISAHISMYKSN